MAGRARGRRTVPGLRAAPLAAALLLLLPGASSQAGAEGRPARRQPAPAAGPEDGPRRPSLVEAAHRNRERIAESRRRGGPAPRYDDAALTAARLPFAEAEPEPRESSGAVAPAGQGSGEASPESASSPEVSDDPGLRDPESREEPSVAERAAARGEQERALRERLLDLEWSLAAVGASGLPYAPRNPNRALDPSGAWRLRAEQEEIRRELAALAEEAGAGKSRRPRQRPR